MQEVSRRRLRNTCLDYLSNVPQTSTVNVDVNDDLAYQQYQHATCLTDKLSALKHVVDRRNSPNRQEAIDSFHQYADHDPLLLNKWFAIQASADVDDLLAHVQQLTRHPDFIVTNPNRLRSLVATFANSLYRFHDVSGKGYEFLANCILDIDSKNPQVAARLCNSFALSKRLDATRQSLIHHQLVRIRDHPDISKDTFEVVSRCLK